MTQPTNALPMIFADTTIALHVAFLLRSLPAIEPCSLRRALIAALESLDHMTRRQSDWLDRLLGTPSETVDFGGLSRIEIAGQCSMITDAVLQRLPSPEVFAMLARFALTEPEKTAGVFGVVAHVAHASPVGNRNALIDLTWRRYLPRRFKGGYALREIEKRTGVSRSTLDRAGHWLDDELDGLELQALRRLERTFVPHGVCHAVEMMQ